MQRWPSAPQLIKSGSGPALIPPGTLERSNSVNSNAFIAGSLERSNSLNSNAFIAGSRLASAVTVTLELENSAGQHVGAVLSSKSLREFFTAIKEGGSGALSEAESVMWDNCGDVSSGGTPVSWVSSNGTAWQCGMRQYDIIVAIRGIDTSEMSAKDVLNIFQEKQDRSFQVVVRRLDAEQQASLLSPSKSGPRLIASPASNSSPSRRTNSPRPLSVDSPKLLPSPEPRLSASQNSPTVSRATASTDNNKSRSPPLMLAHQLSAAGGSPTHSSPSPSPPRRLPPGQPAPIPSRRPPTPPLIYSSPPPHSSSPSQPVVPRSSASPPGGAVLRSSASPSGGAVPRSSASPLGSASSAGGETGPVPSPETPSPPRPTVPRVLQFKSVGPNTRDNLQQRLDASGLNDPDLARTRVAAAPSRFTPAPVADNLQQRLDASGLNDPDLARTRVAAAPSRFTPAPVADNLQQRLDASGLNDPDLARTRVAAAPSRFTPAPVADNLQQRLDASGLNDPDLARTRVAAAPSRFTPAPVANRSVLGQTEHARGNMYLPTQQSASREPSHPFKASVKLSGERIVVLWEAVKRFEFYVTGSSGSFTKGVYTVTPPPGTDERHRDFWVVRDGQCRLEVRWIPSSEGSTGRFLLPMESGYLNVHQLCAIPIETRCQLVLKPDEGSEYLGDVLDLMESTPITDPVSRQQAAKEYMLCCKDDDGRQRILSKLTVWLHPQSALPEEMDGSILADSISVDTLIGLMYAIVSLLTMETIRASSANTGMPTNSASRQPRTGWSTTQPEARTGQSAHLQAADFGGLPVASLLAGKPRV